MVRNLRRQHSVEGRVRAALKALEGKQTIKETTSARAGCGKLFWYTRTAMVRTCGTRGKHPRRIAERDWRDGRGFEV